MAAELRQQLRLFGTLRLRGTEEGGRQTSIQTGYVPDASLTSTADELPVGARLTGVRVSITGGTIEPGSAGEVAIEARYPELWADVRPGDQIGIYEGPRRVATFSVERGLPLTEFERWRTFVEDQNRVGVTVSAGSLVVDGRVVPTRLPAADAVRAYDRLVVLYQQDASPREWGAFANLVAVDDNGVEVWVAETATTTTGDHYYRIESSVPLRALAPSYRCTIDPYDGRVLERVFLK